MKNQIKSIKPCCAFAKAQKFILPAFAMVALTAEVSAQTPHPCCTWIQVAPDQQGGPGMPPDTVLFNILHAYSPADIAAAYGVDALHSEGLTGKGQTIVVVDSYGSPTALEDLQTFSAAFGLPAPDLTIIYPDGQPTYNKAMHGIELNWASETSLDLQWAHATAPDAQLVLIAANPAETQGVQGLPSMFKGIQYALEHYPGSPISQSWATTEQSFNGACDVQLGKYEAIYQQAIAAGCTPLAAAGDWGTANADKQGNVFAYQTVNFPASSPSVTAVGGTWLQYHWRWNPVTTWTDFLAIGIVATSVFPSPYEPQAQEFLNWDATDGQVEAVWREDWPFIPNGYSYQDVTGGGLSAVFAMPPWQAGLPSSLTKGSRSLPDLAFNAAADGGVLTFCTPQGGWGNAGGTSAASPQIAGLVALVNQLRASLGKGPIGHLAPKLYQLPASDFNDIVPQTFGTGAYAITVGDNFRFGYDVPGLPTTPGYDLTTGLGSPKAQSFVHDLATLFP